MHMLVCCPKRTILVPFRQSQHTYVDTLDKRPGLYHPRYGLTRALSAPADTRYLVDSATARIPYRCPLSCWSGAYVTEEKRCTILTSIQHTHRVPYEKRHVPHIMEANHEDFLLRQEVEAANRLFDLQAPLFLASLNIPYTNSFVVAAADEALAYRTDK
jgi:hypothetical protein